MLRLPSLLELDRGMSSRIYLCVAYADMRKGFDSLAAMVGQSLHRDPMSGDLFLFVGRGRDRIKILYWDADGYALWYKRLEEGTFRLPSVASDANCVELPASELAMLLDGIDLRSVRRCHRFASGQRTK